ncbi:MAG: D-alanyl-D-alanine carboxypeptidase [Oscillospiraceae bacterium]|nr:D-alanyl-D-alanine carboxypeptidase [Oscillospiraceae bacterium]
MKPNRIIIKISISVFTFFCVTVTLFQGAILPNAAVEPAISASCAVLIDADTLQILYEKDAQKLAPMASTTKIMTALLMLESGDAGEWFTMTTPMVTVEGTSMGLRPSDQVTRYGLVSGMMLSSGNDAATAAAYILGGSITAFAAMMNARAAQIGMKNTSFVTPSGLDRDGHQSTAYDMALLAAHALKNDAFRAVCSAETIKTAYGNPPFLRTLTNHNRLLQSLDGCIGVKTGYTKRAGRCLVSAAERNGVTLIAVTLRAPNDWEDHKKLYDYGFSAYQPLVLDDSAAQLRLPLVGGYRSDVRVALASLPTAYLLQKPTDLKRVILMRPFEYAPLRKGKIVGTARYYTGTQLLAETPLIVRDSVDANLTPPQPKREGFLRKLFKRLRLLD